MPKIKYKNQNGKRLKSVTTVISNQLGWNKHALIAWYTKLATSGQDPYVELQIAGRIGTLAHNMIDGFINNKKVDQSEFTTNEQIQARMAYNCFCDWHKNNNVKFLESELSLISEKYQFGGTLDAIAIVNDKLLILDWKTSSDIYSEMLIQIAAYRQLYKEYHNYDSFYNIKGAMILKLNKDKREYEEHHFKIKDLNWGWKMFKLLLKLQNNKR